MPSAPQTMLSIAEGFGSKGQSPNAIVSTHDTATLRAAFPASPIHDGEISDDERIKFYQDEVLNGENTQNVSFTPFNPNFTGAPSIPAGVETGDAGKPASAWVPNPVSPGPGNTNPSALPKPPDDCGQVPSNPPGMGDGSQTNPAETSKLIAGQKLGDYPALDKAGSRSFVKG